MAGDSKSTTSAEKKEEKPVQDLPIPEAIDEDDEFEEFKDKNWDASEDNLEDKQEWADDWDDKTNDTNFEAILRKEIARNEIKS